MKDLFWKYSAVYFALTFLAIGLLTDQPSIEFFCMINFIMGCIAFFFVGKQKPRTSFRIDDKEKAASLAETSASNGLKCWIICISVDEQTSLIVDDTFAHRVVQCFQDSDLVWVEDNRVWAFAVEEAKSRIDSDTRVASLVIEQQVWRQKNANPKYRSIVRQYDSQQPFEAQLENIKSLRVRNSSAKTA